MKSNNGFWIFKENIESILLLLSSLAGFEIPSDDLNNLRYDITQTSEELDHWAEYQMEGGNMNLEIKIAQEKDNTDILFIVIGPREIIGREIELLAIIGTEHTIKPRMRY